jgi:hypothetical protein
VCASSLPSCDTTVLEISGKRRRTCGLLFPVQALEEAVSYLVTAGIDAALAATYFHDYSELEEVGCQASLLCQCLQLELGAPRGPGMRHFKFILR